MNAWEIYQEATNKLVYQSNNRMRRYCQYVCFQWNNRYARWLLKSKIRINFIYRDYIFATQTDIARDIKRNMDIYYQIMQKGCRQQAQKRNQRYVNTVAAERWENCQEALAALGPKLMLTDRRVHKWNSLVSSKLR